MAIKITLDSFLAVIKRSGLLSEEQLNSATEKFRAAKGVLTDAKPFAEFLVRQKILTVWQAEKVLQGKHKGFFLGRYRLLSLLGKGGMSSVFLAEHTVMKRFCALKVLPAKRVHDASYLGRFHREAQAVAALDHPNIVRAYDVDMTADAGVDIHFLAMEFVQGKSLLEVVQEKGPVPVADAAEYVRQTALGLDHAHRAGLVHRDVKPGNLLVTPTGVLKVLDLGLARFFDDEDHSLTVQHDEKVLGTADYISPEQAIDSHKVDCRTDIYSLGCTLYFLLTGHPPFNSGSLAQRLVAHQTRPAPSILIERPDVPVGLQAIMEKMMAKKANDRFQTAQEVVDAVALWQKPPATQAVPAAAGVPPVKAATPPVRVAAQPAAPAPVAAVAVAKPAAPVAKALAAKSKPAASPSTTIHRPASAAPVPNAAPASKKSTGSGIGSAVSRSGNGSSVPREAAMDISGGSDADLLGDFLSGMSSGVDLPAPAVLANHADTSSPMDIPGPAEASGLLDFDFFEIDGPAASDSQTSRSSSQQLASAAVETTELSDWQTEVVVPTPPPVEEIDLGLGLLEQLDQAFDPSLLDSGATEMPDTGESVALEALDSLGSLGSLSDIHSLASSSPPSSRIIQPKSAQPKPAQPTKLSLPKFNPAWLAVGGMVAIALMLGLWFMFGRESNSTAIAPGPRPAVRPLPSADLEVIEVGPTGHFATIQEAIAFLRRSFRPLSTFEHRTILVAGGATYPETISIVNGGPNHFPRFVTLRSNGTAPAIIQGTGTQPVLNLQEAESLTIEGFVIDAHGAETAVRVNGYSPSVQLNSLQIQNFKKVGLILEDVSAQAGEEFVIEGLRIQVDAPEAVGIRCQAGTGKNTVYAQLRNLRVIGPLKSGIEISGSFGKSLLTDSVIAGCSVGIRFEGGLLDEVSLINNTLAKNGRGILFSKLPEAESRNLKVLHTLFSGNTQSDAVLENGDVTGLVEKLLAAADGRRYNRTDRKDPDIQGIDLFSGDGQRGATTNFASNAADAPNYLKPIMDINVAAPAGGAKGYVGAVAP